MPIARHRPVRLATIALVLQLGACAPSARPVDAAPRRAPRDGGPAWTPPDATSDGDRYCHVDCFGGHECRDGEVTTVVAAPIPCSTWTGACPSWLSYTCERGCRTDGVTVSITGEPISVCEEGRPKVAGDPCDEDAHCRPPSRSWSDGGIDRLHLRCDLAARTCVPAPDPTPADWMGPCSADLSHLLDPSDEGYLYGFVEDPGCEGGVCNVSEGDTCVRNGCATWCESDDDCPDGATCDESFDRTPRDGGSGRSTRVCRPFAVWGTSCR